MAATWFDLPHEVRYMIIEYALCGSTTTLEVKDNNGAPSALGTMFRTQQCSSLLLVSRGFFPSAEHDVVLLQQNAKVKYRTNEAFGRLQQHFRGVYLQQVRCIELVLDATTSAMWPSQTSSPLSSLQHLENFIVYVKSGSLARRLDQTAEQDFRRTSLRQRSGFLSSLLYDLRGPRMTWLAEFLLGATHSSYQRKLHFDPEMNSTNVKPGSLGSELVEYDPRTQCCRLLSVPSVEVPQRLVRYQRFACKALRLLRNSLFYPRHYTYDINHSGFWELSPDYIKGVIELVRQSEKDDIPTEDILEEESGAAHVFGQTYFDSIAHNQLR